MAGVRSAGVSALVALVLLVAGCASHGGAAGASGAQPAAAKNWPVVGRWRPAVVQAALPGLMVDEVRGQTITHEVLVVRGVNGKSRTVVWRLPSGAGAGDWAYDPVSGRMLLAVGENGSPGGDLGGQSLLLFDSDGAVRRVDGPYGASTGLSNPCLMADGALLWARNTRTSDGGIGIRLMWAKEGVGGARPVTLHGSSLRGLKYFGAQVPNGGRNVFLSGSGAQGDVALIADWSQGVLSERGTPYRAAGAANCVLVNPNTLLCQSVHRDAGRSITYSTVNWQGGSWVRRVLLRAGPDRPNIDTESPRPAPGPPGYALIWGWSRGQHVDERAVPLLLLDLHSGAVKRTHMVMRQTDAAWAWVGGERL